MDIPPSALLVVGRGASLFSFSTLKLSSEFHAFTPCFWEVEILLTTASKPTDHLRLPPCLPSAQGEGWAYTC